MQTGHLSNILYAQFYVVYAKTYPRKENFTLKYKRYMKVSENKFFIDFQGFKIG